MSIVEMLEKRNINHLLLYQLTGQNPFEAFIYVLTTFNAYSTQKMMVLTDIIVTNPSIRDQLSDEVLNKCFNELTEYLTRHNQVLSLEEMAWVNAYIDNTDIRIRIEKKIYETLLRSSDHDGMRKSYKWSITQEDRKQLAEIALKDPSIGSKRKMQIAQECRFSSDNWKKQYFGRLLWDRHYENAKTLVENIGDVRDIVIQAILENVEAFYIDDAIDIARNFIPDNRDIANELQEIQKKLN
ncbi:MAG: hypothetical protein WC666_02800 [Candidatus Paceibacterota bacterium]|jgi:hypothetical protein